METTAVAPYRPSGGTLDRRGVAGMTGGERAGAAPRPQLMPVTQVLALAEQHRRGGDLAAAENLCQQILQAPPTNTHALHLLGLMAHHIGKLPNAISFLKRPVAPNRER